MMIEEFEKRTGFYPTQVQYEAKNTRRGARKNKKSAEAHL